MHVMLRGLDTKGHLTLIRTELLADYSMIRVVPIRDGLLYWAHPGDNTRMMQTF